MTIPQTRIKYAWLLTNSASVVMNEKWGDGRPLQSFEKYKEIAAKYEGWWRPHSDQILLAMCEILQLEFRQNIIDVHVAPWFKPISDPMVISPTFQSANDLVNTLTHEMLHRLITDNTTYPHDHDFVNQWREMFGDEYSHITLVHIPVHAAMQAIYAQLDRPDLLQLDIEQTRHNQPYSDAWKYVQHTGYKEIIDKLTYASGGFRVAQALTL